MPTLHGVTTPEGVSQPVTHEHLTALAQQLLLRDPMVFATDAERTAFFGTLGISPSEGAVSVLLNPAPLKAYIRRSSVWVPVDGQYFASLDADHPNITSDIVPDVITGLSFALPAGYKITFGAWVFHNSASNTPDLDLVWNYSGSTSLYRDWSLGLAASATGVPPYPVNALASGTSPTEYTHGTVGNDVPALLGGIMTTTTAGTLELRAAQNVSSGTAVVIRAGSHIWAQLRV